MEEELKKKLSARTFRKYVPSSLSPTEKREQIRSILKGVRRPKTSKKSRKSQWTIKAEKFFGEDRSKEAISKKTGVPIKALNEIVKRGEKAYFTSGSRPNQTPESWGIARMYAVLFGSKGARKADADLVRKYKIKIFPSNSRMSGKGGVSAEEIDTKKQYPENFSKQTQDTIRKALFNPRGSGLKIMGSMALRSQKYASDYDMMEVVKVPSISVLETRYKRIIRNLLDDPNIFIGDIKLGNIAEHRVVNENAGFVEGKLEGYDGAKSRGRLTELYNKGLVSAEIYRKGLRDLKDAPTIVEWRDILNNYRFNITRWRPKDILRGYITDYPLGNGKEKYTLTEALSAPSLFKMDFFALQTDGIFQEFSIIYDVRLRGKRLNVFPVNTEAKLREEVSYYAQTEQWWKFLKRFFSLTNFLLRTGRGEKSANESALAVLNEILNSDLGILANLRGDIDALIIVMENEDAGLTTTARAKDEVDGFTNRLSNVYSVNEYLKKEKGILGDIDKILKSKSKKPIIKTLSAMYEKITDILNKGAKEKIDKSGLKIRKA